MGHLELWDMGAPWWLLDVETSGLNREKDSIIALWLARLEGWDTMEERTVLVRPEEPLSSWAEGLTGISNRDLERAVPLETALAQLDAIRSHIVFLDQGFTRSFLENSYRKCGREPSLRFLALDGLLERVGIKPRQMTKKLLKALPAPPDSLPGVPPENKYLAEMYQLVYALFCRLEELK